MTSADRRRAPSRAERPVDGSSVARYLQGAELWRLPPGGEAAARRGGAAAPGGGAAPAEGEAPPEVEAAAPELVAGWEDGATFCTAVCSTDVGLGFCRRCPAELATRVLASGRPGSAECPAGVRMLAFPAPRGDERQAAVLRVAPPTPRAAVRIAERIRVSPRTLRQAALDAEPADARAALAAAGVLRSAGSLFDWQVAQRSRGADGRRTATAALAQMVATSEEFQELYRAAQRQRAEFERNQRRLDRLAREALRTQDVERARIAHQIHDTAAQSMVSAYRFLDAARTSTGRGARAGAIDGQLAFAADRLQAAIGEVRAVLNSLLPPGLEELGVATAVRRRLAELTVGSTIAGEVTGDLPRLEGWVEQALYGMTAEALSNAVRHGAPSALHVDLAERSQRVVVTIRDNGSGFDPAARMRRGGEGLGLLGLSRQASWLGGRASIQSRPGAGTTVRISVPYEHYRRAAIAGGAGEAPDESGSTAAPSEGRSDAPPTARRRAC